MTEYHVLKEDTGPFLVLLEIMHSLLEIRFTVNKLTFEEITQSNVLRKKVLFTRNYLVYSKLCIVYLK